jgi:iron complex transport system substrate-binding protein
MMLTVLWLGLGCARQAEEPVQQAARIVSLGSPVTELVYALGRGDSLVGRDSSSLFPEEALALPDVGYHRQLSAEGVLSLAPSLVLATAHAGPPEAIEQLRAAGVTVLLLPEEATAEGARARALAAGDALDRDEAAQALAAQLDAELRGLAPLTKAPKVMFVYARGGVALEVSGQETAADEMIRLVGAQNAISGYTGYKPLTPEAAIAAAPDVLLMTTRGVESAGGADTIWENPALLATPAGQNRRLIVMDDLLLLGFGPRLPEAARQLTDALIETQTRL